MVPGPMLPLEPVAAAAWRGNDEAGRDAFTAE
jgi:hypothetical protein